MQPPGWKIGSPGAVLMIRLCDLCDLCVKYLRRANAKAWMKDGLAGEVCLIRLLWIFATFCAGS
jgi:hypothetical protein